jgi:hypothetical protein
MKKYFQIIFLVIVSLLVLRESAFIIKKGYVSLRILADHQFNYLSLKKAMKGSAIGLAAKTLLPPNSTVTLSPGAWDVNKIAIRYELFPIKVVEAGCFYLDYAQSLRQTPVGWQERLLPYGVHLYAKPGCHFLSSPKSLPNLPLLHLVIFVLLFSLSLIMIGTLTLRTLGISRAVVSVTWFWATAYLIGQLLLTLLLWVFLLFGGTLTRLNILSVWTGVLMGLLLFRKGRSGNIPAKLESRQDSRKGNKWKMGFIIFAMTWIFSIFLTNVSVPVRDWDAMSHWIMKAKVLFHYEKLYFTETHNNHYPLLWPLNIAIQFKLLGGAFDEVAKWSSALNFLCLLAQLNGALCLLRVRKTFLPVVTTFFLLAVHFDYSQSWLSGNFINANAENILLTYLLGTITSILLWLNHRSEKKGIILIGLMATGLCSAKFEGWLIFLLLILSLLILRKRFALTRREISLVLRLLCVVFIPWGWMAWSNINRWETGFGNFQVCPTFGNLFLFTQMFVHRAWQDMLMFKIFLAGLAVVLFAQKKSRDSQKLFLFLFSGGFLILIPGVFVFWKPDWVHENFSDLSSRLFLQAMLPLTLLWASLLFRDDEKGS